MPTERTVLVRLKADVSSFQRGMAEAAAGVSALRKEIDTSSDRTAWLAQGILAIAPAAVRLGAGAVPAVAGIATQMTVAGIAAGTLALGFHGVGAALTALNNYQLQPTTAHLQAMQVAMQKIGPEGEQFVRFLDSLGPQLNDLSDAARAGMFPGMETGIEHLITLLPKVKGIVSEVASGLGELTAEGGKNLAGPKFEEFFRFLETDAKPILLDMGRTAGNVFEGLANLLVAFGPQSLAFSHGLLGMSRAFAEWSRSLDTNTSFQDFLDYIQSAGPQALDFLGAFIQAGTSLIKAWAPVGQVTLPALTNLLDIIAKIADTPIGPAVLGIAALAATYGRLKAIGNITSAGIFTRFNSGLVAQTKAARAATPTLTQWGNAMMHSMHSQEQLNKSFATSIKYGEKNAQVAMQSRDAVTGYVKSIAPAGIALGAFALIASGTSDKLGVTNTAALTMAGTMVGPVGTALGFVAGSFLDAKSAANSYLQTLDTVTVASEKASRAQLGHLKEQAQTAYDSRSMFEKTGNAIANTLANGLGIGHYTSDAQELAGTVSTIDGRIRMLGVHSTSGLHLLTQSLGISNHAARALVGGMQDVEKAFLHMSDVLAKRSSLRDFSQAVDDAATSLQKNGQGLDPFAATAKDRAGNRENQAALDNILTTSIAVAEHLKGLDRQHFLATAREDFIQAAVAMGKTRKGAEELAAKLDVVDKPHKLKVTGDTADATKKLDVTKGAAKALTADPWKLNVNADTHAANSKLGVTKGAAKALTSDPWGLNVNANVSGALRGIRAVASELRALHDKTISVTTLRTTGGHVVAGNADGGTIDGPRWPYGDKVLSWLAPGEEVITNRHGEADQFRADRASGRIPRYADGGTARNYPVTFEPLPPTSTTSSGGTAASTAATAAATAASKAMSGEVKAVTAHLHGLRTEIDAATKVLDKEKQARDALLQKRNAIASSVTDQFRSQFLGVTPDTGVWDPHAGQASNPFSIIRGNIKDARKFDKIIAHLKKEGLDGSIVSQITDLADAKQINALSEKRLQQLEALYGRRQHLTHAVGLDAGNLGYGKQLAHVGSAIDATKAEIKGLRGDVHATNKKLDSLTHATAVTGPDRTVKGIGQVAASASGKGP